MNNADRFKVYGLGFVLGMLLVSFILTYRAASEDKSVDPWYGHREQAEEVGAEPLPEGVEVAMLGGEVLRFGYLPDGEERKERVWLLNFRKSYPFVRVVESLRDGSLSYMAADQVRVLLAEGVDVTEMGPMLEELGISLRVFNRKEGAAVVGVLHAGIDAVPDTLEAMKRWGHLFAETGPDWILFRN